MSSLSGPSMSGPSPANREVFEQLKKIQEQAPVPGGGEKAASGRWVQQQDGVMLVGVSPELLNKLAEKMGEVAGNQNIFKVVKQGGDSVGKDQMVIKVSTENLPVIKALYDKAHPKPKGLGAGFSYEQGAKSNIPLTDTSGPSIVRGPPTGPPPIPKKGPPPLPEGVTTKRERTFARGEMPRNEDIVRSQESDQRIKDARAKAGEEGVISKFGKGVKGMGEKLFGKAEEEPKVYDSGLTRPKPGRHEGAGIPTAKPPEPKQSGPSKAVGLPVKEDTPPPVNESTRPPMPKPKTEPKIEVPKNKPNRPAPPPPNVEK